MMADSVRPRRSWRDAALVDAILGGSREHADELYGAYFPRVYGFALRRLGDPHAAQDVTQEVFAAVFQALPSWRRESSLLAWIYGVTRHMVARHARVRSFGEPDPEAVALLPDRSPGTERVVEARRRVARCHSAVASRLTPLELEIFQLKYLAQSSIAEIAEVVDKSPDAVKSHLYRIRRTLTQGAGAQRRRGAGAPGAGS